MAVQEAGSVSDWGAGCMCGRKHLIDRPTAGNPVSRTRRFPSARRRHPVAQLLPPSVGPATLGARMANRIRLGWWVLLLLLWGGALAAAESWVILQEGYEKPPTKARVAAVQIRGDRLLLLDGAGRTVATRPANDLRTIVEVPPGMDRAVEHAHALAMQSAAEKAIDLMPGDRELADAAQAWKREVEQLAAGMRKEGGRWVDTAAAEATVFAEALARLATPRHELQTTYPREVVDAKVREGEELLSRYPQRAEEIKAVLGAWLGEQLQLGRGLVKERGEWVKPAEAAERAKETDAMRAERELRRSFTPYLEAAGKSHGENWGPALLPAGALLCFGICLITASANLRGRRSLAERLWMVTGWIGFGVLGSLVALAAWPVERESTSAAPDLDRASALQVALDAARRRESNLPASLAVYDADLNYCIAGWFRADGDAAGGPRRVRSALVQFRPETIRLDQVVHRFGMDWTIRLVYPVRVSEAGWELLAPDASIGRLRLGDRAARRLAEGVALQVQPWLAEWGVWESWGVAEVESGRLVLARKGGSR